MTAVHSDIPTPRPHAPTPFTRSRRLHGDSRPAVLGCCTPRGADRPAAHCSGRTAVCSPFRSSLCRAHCPLPLAPHNTPTGRVPVAVLSGLGLLLRGSPWECPHAYIYIHGVFPDWRLVLPFFCHPLI